MLKPLLSSRRRARPPLRWGRVGLACVLLGGGGAWAQSDPAPCPEELPGVALWTDREAGIRVQEQLSQACLKSLVRQCDAEAEAGFMDGSSAATCSLRYEALLRYGFRGNFLDLLRWWQASSRVAIQ